MAEAVPGAAAPCLNVNFQSWPAEGSGRFRRYGTTPQLLLCPFLRHRAAPPLSPCRLHSVKLSLSVPSELDPRWKEVLSISQVRDGGGTPLSNANNKIPTPLFVAPEGVKMNTPVRCHRPHALFDRAAQRGGGAVWARTAPARQLGVALYRAYRELLIPRRWPPPLVLFSNWFMLLVRNMNSNLARSGVLE
ncbi:hypothetical protein ACJJTC_012159 [Scirpophaga incertulas]